MAAPITLDTTVSPDGKIELDVPQLAPGQRVRIVIEPEDQPSDQKRSAAEILASAPGHQLFSTAEEVDAYLTAERDSWDR